MLHEYVLNKFCPTTLLSSSFLGSMLCSIPHSVPRMWNGKCNERGNWRESRPKMDLARKQDKSRNGPGNTSPFNAEKPREKPDVKAGNKHGSILSQLHLATLDVEIEFIKTRGNPQRRFYSRQCFKPTGIRPRIMPCVSPLKCAQNRSENTSFGPQS